MMLPQINHHVVGLAALTLAIVGVGIAGDTMFQNHPESLAQTNLPAVENSAVSTPQQILSQLRQIPQNAFGYAQPNGKEQNAVLSDEPRGSEASEAKNWTEEEWRLANAAVTAFRKGGKKALDPVASSDIVWQPPEEIAKKKDGNSH